MRNASSSFKANITASMAEPARRPQKMPCTARTAANPANATNMRTMTGRGFQR